MDLNFEVMLGSKEETVIRTQGPYVLTFYYKVTARQRGATTRM